MTHKKHKRHVGIRSKISFGIFLIAALFTLSGLISFFELRQIGDNISGALMKHIQNIDLAKNMLDKMHDYETTVMNQVSGKAQPAPREYEMIDSCFISYFGQVYQRSRNPEIKAELDSIHVLYLNLKSEREKMQAGEYKRNNVQWYLDVFYPKYSDMLHRTRNLILENQKLLKVKAADLEVGYYRLVMPGMIATIASVLVLLMLGLFIHVYMVKPLLKITTGIRAYVNYKSPFKVDIATKDELRQLKESVELLINKVKSNSNKMS